ncbi:hypothetical protein RHSP_55260 [Rhizobium freirei PRF 81]|uniref:Uncharacterized protein n=1 Tax=Rhizobium freirei PRF 81 TaxID=363754 RepID=N6TXQ9_9HYPH|nr:hypothetical protein RHSP_55260 [Rhizobium freirei PRF 81]
MALQKISRSIFIGALIVRLPGKYAVYQAVRPFPLLQIVHSNPGLVGELLGDDGEDLRNGVGVDLRIGAIDHRCAGVPFGLVMRDAERQTHHRVLAEDGGRRPVITEPAGLLLEGIGDRAVEGGGRASFDDFKSLFLAIERPEEVAERGLALPAGRAIVDDALLRIIRRGEEFRMFQCLLDRLDLGMGVGQEFGNPPAVLTAFGKNAGRNDKPALRNRLIERGAHGVDPELGRDVRLALLVHGGEGRQRIAGDKLDRAAITFLEDDLVDICRDAGRCPIHFGDRHRAAIGMGGAGEGVECCSKDGGSDMLSHLRPQVLMLLLWKGLAQNLPTVSLRSCAVPAVRG